MAIQHDQFWRVLKQKTALFVGFVESETRTKHFQSCYVARSSGARIELIVYGKRIEATDREWTPVQGGICANPRHGFARRVNLGIHRVCGGRRRRGLITFLLVRRSRRRVILLSLLVLACGVGGGLALCLHSKRECENQG